MELYSAIGTDRCDVYGGHNSIQANLRCSLSVSFGPIRELFCDFMSVWLCLLVLD